ncbi:MAG: putative oxidoreductase [Parcubacteria group bacterium Gr01-1014_3]|nr:MAG: putative oxidoreductase [Parcubacteria group bacterium Gr01-1014_3]
MKFLICGLGSIGQRHYRNLKSLKHDDIIVYRTGKGANDGFVQKFLDEFQPITYTDFQEALNQRPDLVIVANPTSAHMETALAAARAGCNLFIEKPVVHDTNIFERHDLLRLVEGKNLVAQVGYHFRFHPLIQRAYAQLRDGKIGKVVSFHAEISDQVVNWHPWEDYHASYACRRDLGGGVILVQSHAIDWAYYLMGDVKKIACLGGTLGDLNIDVEDTVKILLEFTSGAVGSIELSYLKPTRRRIEIVGTHGSIVWDDKTEAGDLPPDFERNTMYLDEIKHCIECIRSGLKPTVDLKQGLIVNDLALQALGQILRKETP